MEDITNSVRHSITLKERKNMTVSGVSEIVSFDDTNVVLEISDFTLSVEGHELKIESFSHESCDVVINGFVDCVSYSDNKRILPRKGFFGRLFSNDSE